MTGKAQSDKARRAVAHPKRPGERCQAEPGRHVPVIDPMRCEAKRDCVEVCPYEVFEVRRIDQADFDALSILGKLRSLVHGRQRAYTPHAAKCQSCGLCVVACPEGAIRLMPKDG
jgi:NAD-dependent dihydropyrimidine dehydrogenase PreA subunit